ncbi:MAG: aconitate hydratase, partial [Thermodesulfobacteriota bacterium]|nr:aconitate hydratase [Thermodesulfobacteriota bacterium]
LGDSVTTDHISPAGAIAESYPAGRYLIDQGLTKAEFNSYGARRGNHEVMIRGTFGNIRIKNQLVEGKEGSFTIKFPENKEMSIYEAAGVYRSEGVPLVVLGGREYGTGSSRDWAAKGTQLLGVRAVIARSFERIHRSNLVGMGVLPLVFKDDKGYQDLGLDGTESFSITGIEDLEPRKTLNVKATGMDGTAMTFEVIVRLDTEVEVGYYDQGGILPYVLRKMLAG